MARAAKRPAVDRQLLGFFSIEDPAAREAAQRAAYRTLFESELGRVVLLDMMIEAGIGAVEGPPNGIAGHRDYLAGGRDRVAAVLDLAGVDPQHAAQALTTGSEEHLYDRPSDEPEL